MTDPKDPAARRASQVRMAWTLVSVAVVFFIGVIVAQAMGGSGYAFDILGILVVGYLVFVIGRLLRGNR